MSDDDDEMFIEREYENGHWMWDDQIGGLLFVSDVPPTKVENLKSISKTPTGAIKFKDDVDVLEQLRFRRRYQRRIVAGETNIITIQDVKDIALFTAPMSIMSPILINMLHQPVTERFIRALILYCQYYLQISEIMSARKALLETKIRTPGSDFIESNYQSNLCDLRLIIAKEYSTLLLGGEETKKYHHMGKQKKERSMSEKDAKISETLLRICIQIVWIALGRKSFNTIELELNRLFKSEIYNSIEHMIRSEYLSRMSAEERHVLLGSCLRQDQKLNTRSPLLNEIFCSRMIDYRVLALDVFKPDQMSPRLQYLWNAICAPEETFMNKEVVLGIIGQPRSQYDTMLHRLPSDVNKMSSTSQKSANSKKSAQTIPEKLYPEIELPPKDSIGLVPDIFDYKSVKPLPCNEMQRRRWQRRYAKMYQARSYVSSSQ